MATAVAGRRRGRRGRRSREGGAVCSCGQQQVQQLVTESFVFTGAQCLFVGVALSGGRGDLVHVGEQCFGQGDQGLRGHIFLADQDFCEAPERNPRPHPVGG